MTGHQKYEEKLFTKVANCITLMYALYYVVLHVPCRPDKHQYVKAQLLQSS